MAKAIDEFHGWQVFRGKNATGKRRLSFRKEGRPDVDIDLASDTAEEVALERGRVMALETEVAASPLDDRTLWETRLNAAVVDRDAARAARVAGAAARAAAEGKAG